MAWFGWDGVRGFSCLSAVRVGLMVVLVLYPPRLWRGGFFAMPLVDRIWFSGWLFPEAGRRRSLRSRPMPPWAVVFSFPVCCLPASGGILFLVLLVLFPLTFVPKYGIIKVETRCVFFSFLLAFSTGGFSCVINV